MTALEMLMTEWKPFDVKHDKECSGGYTPALPVIANRLAGHYETVLRTMAMVVGADAWMEQAYELAGRTFHVGFRDNRDPAAYNALCATLAERMKAIGYRVRIRKGTQEWRCDTLYITLPSRIEQDAAEAYAPYLQALGKAPVLQVVQ